MDLLGDDGQKSRDEANTSRATGARSSQGQAPAMLLAGLSAPEATGSQVVWEKIVGRIASWDMQRKKRWQLYIVRCADGTLYTGIALDARQRLIEHNESHRGARYTRAKRPVTLVFVQEFPDRSRAAKEEAHIKKLPRQAKLELITQYHGETH